MTIDEAIEMYKKIANTDSNCPRYCMNPCEDCVKECKQVAEWLEELKSYRASVFSGDMTQTMLKEQYCKAIDDFVEELKDYFVIPHDVRVVEMKAEQLKAGGENDNSNSF